MKKTIKDIKIENKIALIRVDFNVPIENGKIADENRIKQALPTIKYALKKKAKVVLFSHLGRIKKIADKKGKSLKPVAKRLSQLIDQNVIFINQTRGEELETAIKNLQAGEILMFENTRFEDINERAESKNNQQLGEYWASLGDVFINDAYGTSHRAHASNVGISENIKEAVMGLLIEKEMKYLDKTLINPQRPLVAILGGAKISGKIGTIENLLAVADKIIISGGMSYTFLKAEGKEIGASLCDKEKLNYAKEILKKDRDKLVLPVDSVFAERFEVNAKYRIGNFTDVDESEFGLDIGPQSIELFKETLKGAKTIILNGPMGVSEWPNFSKGTIAICEELAKSDAITIIGGGDSAAAAIKFGFENKISHISTGGGASLVYLGGRELPGIQALDDKGGELYENSDNSRKLENE